jgi:hypothetical membrane protein
VAAGPGGGERTRLLSERGPGDLGAGDGGAEERARKLLEARGRLDQGSYERSPVAKPRKRRLLRRRRTAPDSASRVVLVPALIAPLVLVGGWNLGASAQPDDYDSLRDSLSDLAALGASHRGIMTGALIVLGLAHVATALLIRLPARNGRIVQAVGGIATVAVALQPLSSESDGVGHAVAATIAFVALALWPAFGVRDDGPPVLHARPMRTAAVVLSLGVIWFGVALALGSLVGLAERVAALAEALWPLIVAWMVREWGGGGGTRHIEAPPEVPAPDAPAPESPEPGTPEPEAPEPVTPVPAGDGGRVPTRQR